MDRFRQPHFRARGASRRRPAPRRSVLFLHDRGAPQCRVRGYSRFSVKLNIRRNPDRSGEGSGTSPVADLAATIDEAQPYRVGRIDIAGNHRHKDGTVRRNLLFEEGQLLDRQLLRRSIVRLNQSMQFEPIDEHDVTIHPNPETGEAGVTFRLTERKHRAWALSGPSGSFSFAGPLEASLSSRLPPWGRGVFELSTYAASVSLIGFARPLLPVLSFTSKRSVLPVLALERPFSPGEAWQSGFVVAPQLGWRRSTASYVVTQVQRRLCQC